MADKTTAASEFSTLASAPYEESPWVADERALADPDAATEATVLLLSEAARHAFRLEPATETGILVTRF